MVCPPERGDNPRALASGLSRVQVGNHGTCITIFYSSFMSKLVKGAIMMLNAFSYLLNVYIGLSK